MKLQNVLVLIADGQPDRLNEAIDITGVALPVEPLAMTHNFDPLTHLGVATLRKEGASIFADLEFNADGVELVQRIQGERLYRLYPAVSGKIGACRNLPETESRLVEECTLAGLSICFNNADKRIPPLDFRDVAESALENAVPVSVSLQLPHDSQTATFIAMAEESMNSEAISNIARVTHELNRAYCAAIGDDSQKPWEEAEEWQRESAISGVLVALNNPDITPEGQHEEWCKHKEADGWKYGPVKDAEKKEHPCLVPYDQLPKEQQIKDVLFRAAVLSLKPDATSQIANKQKVQIKHNWIPTKLTIDGSDVPDGSILSSHNVKILFDDEPVSRLVKRLELVIDPNNNLEVVARVDLVLSQLEVKNLPVDLQAQFEVYNSQFAEAAPSTNTSETVD